MGEGVVAGDGRRDATPPPSGEGGEVGEGRGGRPLPSSHISPPQPLLIKPSIRGLHFANSAEQLVELELTRVRRRDLRAGGGGSVPKIG